MRNNKDKNLCQTDKHRVINKRIKNINNKIIQLMNRKKT